MLRSLKDLEGYAVLATDGEIGSVENFIVDDATWEIRFLVVATGLGWFGKPVLVSPAWATKVSWEESTIQVGVTRQKIKDCPPWDPETAVNHEYEEVLYDYYGRPTSWQAKDDLASREEII